MKALMFDAPWAMPYRDVPDPQARAGHAIVRVKAVGICGSDVHGFTGSTGRRTPGIIMGHEFAGQIESLDESGLSGTGAGDLEFQIGDRVAINPLITCGQCEPCRNGLENICERRKGIGWSVDGAYAELVSVPLRNLRRVPNSLDWPRAALIEPLAVAMRAANLTPLTLGATVVVLGAGTIGLLTLLALKRKGAGKVIVTDPQAHRLELAFKFGADLTINSKDVDAVQAVRDLTNGRGADAVVEAVGITATVEHSIRMARNGGAITWIGNSAPRVELPMQEVVTRELRIQGSYGFGNEFDRALEMLASNSLDIQPLIEMTAPLEQGEEIITGLAKGSIQALKVVLTP
jgi:L-iditol 2-dehydrogenase